MPPKVRMVAPDGKQVFEPSHHDSSLGKKLDWQELSHEKASLEDIQAEDTFRYIFSVLFSQGTPKRLARLLSFIEEHQRKKEEPAHEKQPSVHYISRLLARGTLSLEEVVSELISARVSFDEAFADWKNDQDTISLIE